MKLLFCSILFFTMTAWAGINQVALQIDSTELEALKTEEKYEFQAAKASVNGSLAIPIILKIRGQSCLSAKRKCFGLKIIPKKEKFTLNMANGKTWQTAKFILSSMNDDIGQISMKLGNTIANKTGAGLLQHSYTMLSINGQNIGLYFAIQDPDEVAGNFPWLGRRQSDGDIKTEKAIENERLFLETMNRINQLTSTYVGDKNNIIELERNLDLDNYFEMLTLQALLRNSDYRDEIFFYPNPTLWQQEGRIVFKVFVWDLEDLFAKQEFDSDLFPAPPRISQLLESGIPSQTIIFNLDDPLDYVVALNPSLHKKFKLVATNFLAKRLTETVIQDSILETRNEISPYLDAEGVLPQFVKAKSFSDWPIKKAEDLLGSEGLLKKRQDQLMSRRKFLIRKLAL